MSSDSSLEIENGFDVRSQSPSRKDSRARKNSVVKKKQEDDEFAFEYKLTTNLGEGINLFQKSGVIAHLTPLLVAI
jgi:hypothetical protein